MKRIIILAVTCAVLFSTQVYAQTTRYVKTTGTTTAANAANATSWAAACNDLQAVINVSAAGDSIWVATGTYKPNRKADALTSITANNRDNAFVLKAGVRIYGSFAGTETTLAQRQLPTGGNYGTILSGDIGTPNDSTDNCYHIVIGVNIPNDNNTVLDGFTITGGYADNTVDSITVNGYGIDKHRGGGIYNRKSSPVLENITVRNNAASHRAGGIYNYDASSPVLTNVSINNNKATYGGGILNYISSPVLTDVTINNNTAYSEGGGISNFASSPVLTDVTISNNRADFSSYSYGGGMRNNNSNPILTNVTLSDNKATDGGGMYNDNSSSPVLTNVTISNNIATSDGGGMYNNNSSPVLTDITISNNIANICGGGMYNNSSSSPELVNVIIKENIATNSGGGMYNNTSHPILTNAIISSNTAGIHGGGIYNYNSSQPVLTNVTISNNKAVTAGAGVRNANSSSPDTRNSIIWGNTLSSGTVSNVENSSSNPTYSNTLVGGETIGNGIILNGNPMFVDTANRDYYLLLTSPCVNAGSNAFYSPDSTPDLSHITTDIAGNPRSFGNDIDLGAYEYTIFYTVTFESNGGTTVASIQAVHGATISKPADPTKTGNTFEGWYKDAGLTNSWDFTTDMVISDTTLYAKWKLDVGISEINTTTVKLYPNPTTGQLTMDNGELAIENVEVYDVYGKLILRHCERGEAIQTIDISHLSNGVYFVKIKTEKGEAIRKIVKQ